MLSRLRISSNAPGNLLDASGAPGMMELWWRTNSRDEDNKSFDRFKGGVDCETNESIATNWIMPKLLRHYYSEIIKSKVHKNQESETDKIRHSL